MDIIGWLKGIGSTVREGLNDPFGRVDIRFDKDGTQTVTKYPGKIFNRKVESTPIVYPPGYEEPSVMDNLRNILSSSTVKAVEPTPTALPTPTPQPYHPKIGVPSTGGTKVLPENIAQVILSAFNASGEATTAARVLHHPEQNTYSKAERERAGEESINRGENPDFVTGEGWVNERGVHGDWNYDKAGNLKYITNPFTQEREPSEDRGLFRIHNATFYDLQRRNGPLLESFGIKSYSDMYDPYLNSVVAKIIKDEGGWKRWYAAPLSMRYPNE